MKTINRDKIQRMVGDRYGGGGSRGESADLAGYASQIWVNQNFVSKKFFARLFTINGTDENDDDVVVEPNDLDTDITNIQAMVGLWTEQYLSALGQGSGGGGGGGALLTEPLASINEAGMGTPSGANKVITWNGSTWTYMPYTTGNGTVTSIRIAVPTGFSVNPSTAITTSGTFTISFARGTLGNGVVLATPSSGTGDPIWRALVADDIPSLAASKIASGTFDAARIPDLSWTKITSDKPTTLLGYGISDAKIENGIITLGHATITPLTDAKLKNDYEWWGAKLDSTTGKREGNMSNVGNISFSASGKNIGSIAYFDTNNTRLGIGAPPGAYLLDVAGRTKTTRLYLADDVYLVYDSSNGGVHIVGAGLYTDTYVSALGAGSGGGSGSGITMNDVWDALAATAPSASSQQIDLTHLTSVSTYFATRSYVQNVVSDNAVLLTGAQSISGTKTFTGGLVSSGANNLSGGVKAYSICVECNSDGSPNAGHSGEINRFNNANLHLQYDSNTGSVTMCRQQFEFMHSSANGCTIKSNGNKFTIDTSQSSTLGEAWLTGSAWHYTSDIRKKDVYSYVDASVEQIAEAPIFNFRWKKAKDGKLMLGTDAGYWQKTFPNAVATDEKGYLGLDYSATALAAAVMASREIMRLKKRIEELEKKLKAS